MAPAGPIALYGATGYTGRLVARELARRELDFVLCGRSASKLAALAGELAVDAPLRAASLDDRDALRHALGDCAAVINCAGPFTRYGEPVVRAAVETGTHYVDTTGEQRYMQRIYERYGEPAEAAEVAVIPAVGFDYVPGDLICRLAGRGREPLSELVVAYAVSGFGATRGTLHSALEAMRGRALDYESGAWSDAGLAPVRASFRFPDGVGRQVMSRYPSGEVVTVPRHTRTRAVRSLINASAFAPHPALAPAVPFAVPGLAISMHTPLKALVDLAIDRLPEGPSEEQRRNARFTIVALARGDDGRLDRGVVRGSDMYGLTAVTAVHSAALLASPGYRRSGTLSPASAFDPVEFLDHLGDHGVSYALDRAAEEAAA
jgi:short subunit dehydrogenase-like uncharacterized protein